MQEKEIVPLEVGQIPKGKIQFIKPSNEYAFTERGIIRTTQKQRSKQDKCHCGSNKRYYKCCLHKDRNHN